MTGRGACESSSCFTEMMIMDSRIPLLQREDSREETDDVNLSDKTDNLTMWGKTKL